MTRKIVRLARRGEKLDNVSVYSWSNTELTAQELEVTPKTLATWRELGLPHRRDDAGIYWYPSPHMWDWRLARNARLREGKSGYLSYHLAHAISQLFEAKEQVEFEERESAIEAQKRGMSADEPVKRKAGRYSYRSEER